MVRILLILNLLIASLPAIGQAETVLAANAIRAGSVLSAADLKLSPTRVSGAISEISLAVGLQAKRNLFPGRAIFANDLQQPHIVTRNQIVSISFQRNGLSIVTAGRALDGGAVGDMIRVLNASSRKTIFGTVRLDGSIQVSGGR